jgi:hypothetical protein
MGTGQPGPTQPSVQWVPGGRTISSQRRYASSPPVPARHLTGDLWLHTAHYFRRPQERHYVLDVVPLSVSLLRLQVSNPTVVSN